MKLVAIEPTPSPNNLKIIVEPAFTGRGVTYDKASLDMPPIIEEIVGLRGVKSVYAVSDFLAVERHPKHDWHDVMNEIRRAFGEDVPEVESNQMAADYEPVHVSVQFVLDVPMQLKLVKGDSEKRVGLSKRFVDAALDVQAQVKNIIQDRRWVEQAPRYGELEEVSVVAQEELEAAYPEERVARIVARAFGREADYEANANQLQSDDWKVRLAFLDELEIIPDNMVYFRRALEDKVMAIRRQAVVMIGMFEENREEYVTYIEQALVDSSPIVRRTAGDTVSDWALPQSQPSMIEALKDKSKLVRWRAARFLFDCGDDEAVPALKLAEEDREFEVSLQARLAKERITSGETALGTVWQQISNRTK
ncbi:virulence factor [Exiguobacterium sp. TNDT2]|uniref:virulence factor n=1 Tax=Exiguobacterium sp. TNDT2 TaxID=2233531 RepID=UPI000DEEED39|nr:virulence factor [Exiguobacterium sp. TNDT2]